MNNCICCVVYCVVYVCVCVCSHIIRKYKL